MIVGVAFEGQLVQYELAPHQLHGHWTGPLPSASDSLRNQVRNALERPHEYPPLSSSVVPGDRVVIPTDPWIPNLSEVLDVLCSVLLGAGVEASDITILWTKPNPVHPPAIPDGVKAETHGPGDRERSAYLATTTTGRRVYLDRLATDADVVIPVGALSYAGGEYRGPWSEVFPGLSDLRPREAEVPPKRTAPQLDPATGLEEAAEVGWLLGSHFQVGLVVGADGVANVIAGQQDEVRRRGVEAIAAQWSVQVEEPVDLVIAGIGVRWKPATLDDLATALETATRLVRVGGKIVLLAKLMDVQPGQALRRIAELDDPRQGLTALRGLKREPDYPVARRLVKALAHADIYLYSELEPEFVESLGLIPLDDPSDARRLVERCGSCIMISPAERMRVEQAERAASSPEGSP